MTEKPAAVEALKLAEQLKKSLTFADAHTTLWYAEKIDRLAALAHQSPPTGVSGSQAKSEAVGWFESPHGQFRANPMYRHEFPSQLLKWQIPLYAAPQEAVERQPLTPEQARNVWRRWTAEGHAQCDWLSLLRLTERAHGIGPATQEMQR